ncbi:ligand-binding sensor domain-containing protein [Flavivirga spongiicola]|uniref:Histidine kinase n=1 Tax=Flavivirga spongiicola TaxID=421621 RepID=A0ABU7XQY7_9FLAO|nr:sensor histidine kinase [Flavivirga sp. MEBiC05379]MDO5977956.1 two-component regulator propeller domain-containing protein [Flavivirga sp. MEBiC05379]
MTFLAAMRNFKWVYLLSILFLISCGNSSDSKLNSVQEDIDNDHYQVLITGDTLQTNIPIKLEGKKTLLNQSGVTKTKLKKPPKIVKSKNTPKKIKNIETILVSLNQKLIKHGENDVSLPKDTILEGNKSTVFFPKPVKSEKPLYRDNAILDIQWMDVDQGLNSSYVVYSFEDSRNNIWMGYYGGGVSKFDGVEFLHFTEKEGLFNNYVWTIFEDSKQNLWFGHYSGGVTKYDGKTFTHYSDENGFPDRTIWSIIEDSAGNIWFGTANGVVKYNGEIFTHYTKSTGLIGNDVVSMVEDQNKNIWFATKNSGISIYNGESFYSLTKENGLPDNRILSVYEASNKEIWIGTYGGACRYNGHSLEKITTKEGLTHNKVISIVEDQNNNIWFGTHGGGLSRYDGKTIYNITKKEGLPHDEIRHLLIDSKNNIWGGTEGAGLFKFNPNSFLHYTKNEGLPTEQVFSIYEDKKGHIWFGTYGGGLSKYDGSNFIHYGEEQGLVAKKVISLTEDSKGNIWFGTFSQGLFKFDGEVFTQYDKSSGLSENMVWSVLEDREGNIWIGTEMGGLDRFDGKEFVNYNFEEGFSSYVIWDILEDTKGNVWIATNRGGVCKYKNEAFTFYAQKEGLPSDIVWTILEDKKGNIWFGTHKGVCVYNGKTIKSFAEDDGLSNNIVWSLLQDQKENIWMGTSKGLNCVVLDKELIAKVDDDVKMKSIDGYITNFQKNDGLKSTIFYANSSLFDKNHDMWFGTISGVINFNLNSFNLIDSAPSIQLNTIDINQKSINYSLLSDTIYNTSTPFLNKIKGCAAEVENFHNYPKHLELPFNFNHLTFKFAGIDWSAPHSIEYAYKIDGLDEAWSILSSENKADYRNIPPGTYTFNVKAISKSGQWSKPLQYKFSISPPWWLSLWAINSYIILSILLIIGSFKWYGSRMKKKQLVLEHIVEERTRTIAHQKEELSIAYDDLEQERNKMELKALLNQINPHFIFNALNSIQQFVISNNVKTSLDYFNKFGKLIRASLEHSEMKFVSIDDEIQVIRNYVDLENLRFHNPIVLNFVVHDIDIYNVKIPPMFIQPIVENAIIHGLSEKETDKEINIHFEEFKEHILCSIHDNGLGRKNKKSMKNKNSGMIITKKRLKSVWNTNDKKDIEVVVEDLKEPTGTIVKIKLPKDF